MVENIEISINKKELAKEKLLRLRELRFDYISEIPQERLTTKDKDYQIYKCRNHWFIGIRNEVWNLIDKSVITDQKIIEDFEKFHEILKTNKSNRYTTEEDIKRGDQFLDQVISYLEQY